MNRSKKDFLESTIGEVVWAINKHNELHRIIDIANKNLYIGLFRSVGSRFPYIKDKIMEKTKEKDIYVDSFDDML